MTNTPTLPELPDPTLYQGTKLVPYEQRHFFSPGMREKLGYTHSPSDYFTADQMRAFYQLGYADAIAANRVVVDDAVCLSVIRAVMNDPFYGTEGSASPERIARTRAALTAALASA